MGMRSVSSGAAWRLVLLACVPAVLLAPSPVEATTGTWSQGLAVTIAAGSTLRAGYDVSMPGAHPAASLTVSSGTVVVGVKCSDGSQTHLVVGLAAATYQVAAGDNAWLPSGNSADASTYQGAVAVPSSFCAGRSGTSGTVTFSADFTSTDATDKVSVRFHVADGSSGGKWSGPQTVVPSAAAGTASSPAPASPGGPAPPGTRSSPPVLGAPHGESTPAAAAASATTPRAAATASAATPASPFAATASPLPPPLALWITPAPSRPVAALQDAADATPGALVAAAVAVLAGAASWAGRRRHRRR